MERKSNVAEKAGETLKEYGFNFDKAYTSYLKRAVKTLNCVLDKMNLDWIPVEKSWRLNEKHYGELQGLNKSGCQKAMGKDSEYPTWQRSFRSSLSKGKPCTWRREAVGNFNTNNG